MTLTEQLMQFIASNHFFTGGAALGIAGSVFYQLKSIPYRIYSTIKRKFIRQIAANSWDDGSTTSDIRDFVFKHEKDLWFKNFIESYESRNKKMKIHTGTCVGYVKGCLFLFAASQTEKEQRQYHNVSVTFPNKSHQLRFIKLLDDFVKEESDDEVYVKNVSIQESSRSCPKRMFKSACFDEELEQDIRRDINNFLDLGKKYRESGIPHKRSYLLQGKPGNGKSTLPFIVASELEKNYAKINLTDPKLTDSHLTEFFSDLSNEVVVIEEIDTIFHEREKQTENSLTFGALLYELDNPTANYRNTLMFFTANDPSKIDPALMRNGRIDKVYTFENATKEQVRRLYLNFFEDYENKEEAADLFVQQVVDYEKPVSYWQEIILAELSKVSESKKDYFQETKSAVKKSNSPGETLKLIARAYH